MRPINIDRFPISKKTQRCHITNNDQEVGYGPGKKKEVWIVVPSKENLQAKYALKKKWPRDEDFQADLEEQPREHFIADHRGENRNLHGEYICNIN